MCQNENCRKILSNRVIQSRWNFSTINACKDDSDNNRFCWTFAIKKCIFTLRKWLTMWPFCLFLEICNYQGHPYLMWKSSNIIWITLLCNILLQHMFWQTFLNFSQILKQFLLMWLVGTLVRNFKFCRICQHFVKWGINVCIF